MTAKHAAQAKGQTSSLSAYRSTETGKKLAIWLVVRFSSLVIFTYSSLSAFSRNHAGKGLMFAFLAFAALCFLIDLLSRVARIDSTNADTY